MLDGEGPEGVAAGADFRDRPAVPSAGAEAFAGCRGGVLSPELEPAFDAERGEEIGIDGGR